MYRCKPQKEISIIRFFNYSDRTSDIVDLKPKHDDVLGPAIQRGNLLIESKVKIQAHFFKINLSVKKFTTENETEEFVSYVNENNIHTAIIGYDKTEATRQLISGNISFSVLTN